ncbi:hypothetical protein OUZ56_008057 [Daphnia magna]|uniref:Uncharacterized protein n=1 Tax=Daphnia magna TaxID=35525 RepID=A0ABR0ABZ7_9CRUS|nr:hypothetical protein OUZ56_008057 [Daphnia magna]
MCGFKFSFSSYNTSSTSKTADLDFDVPRTDLIELDCRLNFSSMADEFVPASRFKRDPFKIAAMKFSSNSSRSVLVRARRCSATSRCHTASSSCLDIILW